MGAARLAAAATAAAVLLCMAPAVDAQRYRSKSRTPKPTPSGTATATATASGTATASATATGTPEPRPPPHAPQPGELWAAFFALNTTDACATDTTQTAFYAARWVPTTSGAPDGGVYTLSQPFAWPSLSPIHSKTLGSGIPMAVDAVGRRGWAVFATQDWSSHVWVMQLAFPLGDPASIVLEGVCELLGASAFNLQLHFHPGVHATGPWLWNASYSAGTQVLGVDVPPAGGGGPPASIPPCAATTVGVIADPALQVNAIPGPFVGTDADGKALIVTLATSQTNASQTNVTAWSPASGQRVFGPATYACGDPSYLYACPPTNGAGWPLSGLFTYYLVNGTLLVGGGAWSAQQLFMTQLPARAGGGGGGGGDGAGDAGVPAMTFVNASANQATWLAASTGGTSAFVPAPGRWPLSAQYLPGPPAACASPTTSYGGYMVMAIDESGWDVSTPFTGGGPNPGCPLRAAEIPWLATAACAGASVGTPDLITAFH